MALVIEELSEKFEKMKKTTICHCATSVITNELKFEWTLKDFSIPSKSVTTFKATGITHCYQAFTLNVSFNMAKNMIYFHTWFMAEKKNIKANYYIYIDVNKKILYPCEVNGIYLTQNMIVYEISLNKIQKYGLTCDGLTVYFRFDIIESVSNHFFQTIIDESEESAIDKFALDKRLGLKAHFLLDKKSFSVDKGLIRSKSDVFKDRVEQIQNKSEKIHNVLRVHVGHDLEYDVYEHFVSYLETGSLDKLSEDGNIHDVEFRMNIRSFRSTQYDKVHEILHNLFNIGKEYKIQDLALLCEKLLIKVMHRLDIEKDLRFAHTFKARTLNKYARQFFKLDRCKLNYFEGYPVLYPKLINENLNCHKMSFITEEYDSDTFNA